MIAEIRFPSLSHILMHFIFIYIIACEERILRLQVFTFSYRPFIPYTLLGYFFIMSKVKKKLRTALATGLQDVPEYTLVRRGVGLHAVFATSHPQLWIRFPSTTFYLVHFIPYIPLLFFIQVLLLYTYIYIYRWAARTEFDGEEGNFFRVLVWPGPGEASSNVSSCSNFSCHWSLFLNGRGKEGFHDGGIKCAVISFYGWNNSINIL